MRTARGKSRAGRQTSADEDAEGQNATQQGGERKQRAAGGRRRSGLSLPSPSFSLWLSHSLLLLPSSETQARIYVSLQTARLCANGASGGEKRRSQPNHTPLNTQRVDYPVSCVILCQAGSRDKVRRKDGRLQGLSPTARRKGREDHRDPGK